jgi:uncharacterized protein YndB with AHSA1/START domain
VVEFTTTHRCAQIFGKIRHNWAWHQYVAKPRKNVLGCGLAGHCRCSAQVEKLWELWTTKEGFESWWGPEGFRAQVHAIEARRGGALGYDMIAGTPEMVEAMKQMGRPPSHGTRGIFSEFRPYEHLTLTHVIDFLPGEEFTRMSIEGFTSQLTKLDKRFVAGNR